jgi:hypothetical protein
MNACSLGENAGILRASPYSTATLRHFKSTSPGGGIYIWLRIIFSIVRVRVIIFIDNSDGNAVPRPVRRPL